MGVPMRHLEKPTRDLKKLNLVEKLRYNVDPDKFYFREKLLQ